MTSKQRAYLRSIASTEETIFQIGKMGCTPEVTTAVEQAIEKRELIKISILNNCDEDIQTVARMLAERTHSELIQVIGKKIVLYKRSEDKPVIELPN